MTRHLRLVSVAGTTVVDAPAPFGATLPTPAPAVAKVSNGIAYGDKYERDLDVDVIAKRVRADIKAAVAAGELPAAKYSVRISRYSMGRSLTVTVDELPFAVCNPERVRRDVLEPHDRSTLLLRTEEAQAAMAKVEAIVDAYNFDGSRPQEDYSHVNFYGHVSFGGQYDREWTELHAKYDAEKSEALRPVREANFAKVDALIAKNERREACPAAWTHDSGAGCSLCEES
jgi:hypothetical protein